MVKISRTRIKGNYGKVAFEGIINPIRFAKFKKLEDDTTFFAISKGI
jgi:hypothetical protein